MMTQQQVDAHDALICARARRDAAIVERDKAEKELYDAMLSVIRCEDTLNTIEQEPVLVGAQ